MFSNTLMVNPIHPNLRHNLHLQVQYNFQAGIDVLHVAVYVDDHALKMCIYMIIWRKNFIELTSLVCEEPITRVIKNNIKAAYLKRNKMYWIFFNWYSRKMFVISGKSVSSESGLQSDRITELGARPKNKNDFCLLMRGFLL